MKSLVKLLAVLTLLTVLAAFVRSAGQAAFSVGSNAVCDTLSGQARSRGGSPVTIDFTATGHLRGGGAVAGYGFDFGDGSAVNQTTNQTTHVYSKWGNFVAKAYTYDSLGNSANSCTLDINVPPPGTLCLNWQNGLCQKTSSRTIPAAFDQDINIELRQFISVPATPNIIDFVHDTAPAPQLCALFPNSQIPAFTALYAVGITSTPAGIDNSKSVEQSPPHMTGFQTPPGQGLYTPPIPSAYGYIDSDEQGHNYSALVLYAGTDANGVGSLVLKYTLDDNVIFGYTIHLLGVNIDPSLQQLYNQADSSGRWYLPALTGGQVIGASSGQEFWTVIRDTGAFLDPRWYRDWWKNCPGAGPLGAPKASVTPGHPPGYTTTIATPISTGGPNTTYLNGTNGPYPIPIYPPLGSLVACPGEIPAGGSIAYLSPPMPPNSTSDTGISTNPSDRGTLPGNTCGLQPIPEPAHCADGLFTNLNESCSAQGTDNIAWCYPQRRDGDKLVKQMEAAGKLCAGNYQATKNDIAKYTLGFCVNNLDSPTSYLGRLTAAAAHGCTGLNDQDKDTIAHCLGYVLGAGSSVPTIKNSFLPACIPTSKPAQQCVTECSQPVDITEKLKLFPDQGCLRNGDCLVKMQIKNNTFQMPFVRNLADYFGGTLDAENLTSAQLDDVSRILHGAGSSGNMTADQVFQQAGVARKLLPSEIQDRLKCQFIKYVRDKKAAGGNSKYLDRTGKDTYTELMVYDQKITDIPCPPTVDSQSPYKTHHDWETSGPAGETAKWPDYWFAVPLFPNDNAQGEIQFVNPTIFSSAELGNDPKYPGVTLGPIYVSLPDVNKLSGATNIIQQALIPSREISARLDAVRTDPKNNLPTYGQAINPATPITACTLSSWGQYYNQTKQLYYDPTGNVLVPENTPGATRFYDSTGQPLTEYSRAVTCDIPTVSGNSSADNQVCVVGPTGQLRCFHQEPGSAPLTGVAKNFTETVQVRTVFPELYQIAEQTIQNSTGLLRVFKPGISQISSPGLYSSLPKDAFEQSYAPLPAGIGNIKYETSDRAITVDNTGHESGWQIFFYKLGGVWNARNFVLDLLSPKPAPSKTP